MVMRKRRWIGLGLGIMVFLGAFGAALAFTIFQASQEVPSTLKLRSAVVISADNIGLWHDMGKTKPVNSLEYLGVLLQKPLQGFLDPETELFIENRSSNLVLRMITPCNDVESPPARAEAI